jgi:hypothetical protein
MVLFTTLDVALGLDGCSVIAIEGYCILGQSDTGWESSPWIQRPQFVHLIVRIRLELERRRKEDGNSNDD